MTPLPKSVFKASRVSAKRQPRWMGTFVREPALVIGHSAGPPMGALWKSRPSAGGPATPDGMGRHPSGGSVAQHVPEASPVGGSSVACRARTHLLAKGGGVAPPNPDRVVGTQDWVRSPVARVSRLRRGHERIRTNCDLTNSNLAPTAGPQQSRWSHSAPVAQLSLSGRSPRFTTASATDRNLTLLFLAWRRRTASA